METPRNRIIELLIDTESYQTPYAKVVSKPEEITLPLLRTYCIKITAISTLTNSLPSPITEILIIPEVYTILQLQCRMIKDIAAIYGKEKLLNKDILLYCLFQRQKSGLWERLLKMTGTRVLIRSISHQYYMKLFEEFLQKKTFSYIYKLSYFLGLLSSGLIGFIDTRIVGMTAIELFSREIQFEESQNNEANT